MCYRIRASLEAAAHHYREELKCKMHVTVFGPFILKYV